MYWDQFLKENWDNAKFNWPTKNKLVEKYFSKNDIIIDIGFGTGTLLKSLRLKGFKKLWGYEQSDFALRQIAALNIQTVKGGLPVLNLNNSSFDGIIASEVLEHVFRRKCFLKEIRRVLRDGGTGVITTPDNCMGPEEEHTHTFKYNNKTLEKLLSKFFFVKEIYSIQDINHQDPSLVAVFSK